MRKFDYSFLKKDISSKILNVSNVIYDLKSKEGFRKEKHGKTFELLKKIAIVESVKGSNKIEGIIATDKRINEIIKGDKPITHNEKEISGYKDVLNVIHENYSLLELNEKTILDFHRLMLSQVHDPNRGKYKDGDNIILDTLGDGTRQVRFVPVSSKETNDAMKQMLLAYYEARQDSEINQLLLIACVVFDFLCIHPFNDGNGRISRLITLLLLYKNDFDIGCYISIEALIEKYKYAYYEALKESSYGWEKNENTYEPFIINFMQIIYYAYKKLDEKFIDMSLKKVKKSEQIENVVLNSLVPISKASIVEYLPDISVKTIELVLNKMIKEEKIIKIGSFKDARYYRK